MHRFSRTVSKKQVPTLYISPWRRRKICFFLFIFLGFRRLRKRKSGRRAAFPRRFSVFRRRIHTGIHEKQDNCLVLIAPTARWILRKRPDAQSASGFMRQRGAHGISTERISLGIRLSPASGCGCPSRRRAGPCTPPRCGMRSGGSSAGRSGPAGGWWR